MSTIALLTTGLPSTNEVPELSAVSQAFMQSPYRHLHRMACQLEDGELVLRGIVRTYYLKQFAQEVARKVAGGWRLRNDIEVLG